MNPQKFLLVLSSFILFTLTVIRAQEDAGIFMPDPRTLIYLPKVNLTLRTFQEKPRYTLSFPKVDIKSTPSPRNVTVDITFGTPEPAVKDTTASNVVLRLEIVEQRGSWFLTKSFLSGTVGILGDTTNYNLAPLKTSMELTAPIPMSFHCGKYGPFSPKLLSDKEQRDKKSSNVSISIELLDFQMQTFMKPNNNTRFGDSYDCVGFFSIGILSGWFVTIMLLAILSWAISMIMNVHTMDRFDDPKGKSIQVSATD